MTDSNNFSRRVALSAILLAFALPVSADDVQDASALFKQKQYDQALAKVNSALANSPKDMKARFLKAVIYAEQGRTNDAIVVFQQIIADYPNVPEPYNNLGVLYTSLGQYKKAELQFETAIRLKPNYAIAHENLGDLRLKMASDSYGYAVDADRGNTKAKGKRDEAAALSSGQPVAKGGATGAVPHTVAVNSGAATPVVAAKPTPVATVPAKPVAPAVPVVAAKPEPVKPAAPVAKVEPVKPAPVAVAKPAPVAPAVKPEPVKPVAPVVAAKPEPAKPAPVAAAPVKPVAPATPVVVAKPEPVKPAAPVAKVEPVKPAPVVATKPAPVAPAVKPEPVKPVAPVVAAKPEPAKPAPVVAAPAKPVAPAAPVVAAKPAATKSADDRAAIEDAVRAWASAWSAQDSGKYLSYYSNEFNIPGGMSRSAWESQRKDRLSKPKFIKVGIADLKVVKTNSDHATVTFQQAYASSTLNETAGKTLVMVKSGSGWLIREEKSAGGAVPAANKISVEPTLTPADMRAPVHPSRPVLPATAPRSRLHGAEGESIEPAHAQVVVPSSPVKPAGKASSGSKDDVTGALYAWASAWSARDAKKYLSFYSKEFSIPGDQSRAEWEANREGRISKPSYIRVSVDDIKVTQRDANHATVSFVQTYKSNTLNQISAKRLVMEKNSAGWQILEEKNL